MSKRLALIKYSSWNKERDLSVSQFSTGGTLNLQLTQGFSNLSGDPDEPGFIHLTERDTRTLIPILISWLESLTEAKSHE